MMTWRFVSGLAFLAVVICALADETKPFPETSPAVAMRYGRWVDSGPRVIDESGAPLAGVEVTLRTLNLSGCVNVEAGERGL